MSKSDLEQIFQRILDSIEDDEDATILSMIDCDIFPCIASLHVIKRNDGCYVITA